MTVQQPMRQFSQQQLIEAITRAMKMDRDDRDQQDKALQGQIDSLRDVLAGLDVAKPDALYRSATAKRLAATKTALIAYAVDFQNHKPAIMAGPASPVLRKAIPAGGA